MITILVILLIAVIVYYILPAEPHPYRDDYADYDKKVVEEMNEHERRNITREGSD